MQSQDKRPVSHSAPYTQPRVQGDKFNGWHPGQGCSGAQVLILKEERRFGTTLFRQEGICIILHG